MGVDADRDARDDNHIMDVYPHSLLDCSLDSRRFALAAGARAPRLAAPPSAPPRKPPRAFTTAFAPSAGPPPRTRATSGPPSLFSSLAGALRRLLPPRRMRRA